MIEHDEQVGHQKSKTKILLQLVELRFNSEMPLQKEL